MKRLSWAKRSLLLVGGVLLFVATGAGVAIGHGGDGALIHACVKKSGDIKIAQPGEECKKHEVALDWSSGSSASTRTRVSESLYAPQGLHTLRADCPSGSQVVGGGAATNAAGWEFNFLIRSYPTYPSNPLDPAPEGWAAKYSVNAPVTLYVFAICETP